MEYPRMLGIDTNILVRYITQDGDEASLATDFLETRCLDSTPGFICHIVICELVWVLKGAYKYDKNSIVSILNKLLTTVEFEIEDSLSVWQALQAYKKGNADFSDYLIGYVCFNHDTDSVYTFDKKAAKIPFFELLA